MTKVEQNIGKSKLWSNPSKPLHFKLKEGSVKTQHIENKAVTPEKLSDTVGTTWFRNMYDQYIKPVVDSLHSEIQLLSKRFSDTSNELYSMIASLQVGGVALSNDLGSREDIGISQKALTDIVNSIHRRLDDLTGEYTRGFTLKVTPDYFIVDDTCDVVITAVSENLFETIAFYADEELLVEAENVHNLTHIAQIDRTCHIRCVAKIMGMRTEKSKLVTKYYPFFIGGGQEYHDILIPECAREYHGSFAGGYDVDCKEGDRIIVLVPLSQDNKIVRIDMNSYEIPFRREVNDKYVIYTSINTYKAGTWNIDITDNKV